MTTHHLSNVSLRLTRRLNITTAMGCLQLTPNIESTVRWHSSDHFGRTFTRTKRPTNKLFSSSENSGNLIYLRSGVLNFSTSKIWPRLVGLFIFFFGPLFAPLALAETVNFDGSPASLSLLQDAPDWYSFPVYTDSLFPGPTSDPGFSGNQVNISGGTIGGLVFGGLNQSDPVFNNQVNVTGGTVVERLYGGWSYYGQVYGNSVTISGGQLGLEVFGGYAEDSQVYDNTLTISGGNLKYAYGGSANVGMVTGNTVFISGGTVENELYGGYSYDYNAENNAVFINGGYLPGKIFGGASFYRSATGNLVALSGQPIFDQATTNIYGGGSGYTFLGEDAFTGNILMVANPIASPVNSIQNFELYRFVLPASQAAPLIRTTDLDLTDGGTRAARVDQLALAPEADPGQGARYILINSANAITSGSYSPNRLEVQKGLSLKYEVDVSLDDSGHNLVATIASSGTVTPQTKAFSEGRASSLGFVSQGGELAAGGGVGGALSATACQAGALTPFGAMAGGSSRYNSGSHTDVKGFSMMTGLGWSVPVNQHSLLLGAFFEAGRGDYDSYNSFRNQASIHGQGDTKYYGGGLLARYDLANCDIAGLYLEGSLRAGRAEVDFHSSDFRDSSGPREAFYESSSPYYGAHAGLGYIWGLTEQLSLDLSTKYLWTHQGGDNVLVAGDPIHFQSVDSHRWRTGARLAYGVSTESGAVVAPYAGAALDYEFGGEAQATVYGRAIEAPSLRGATGVGQLGVSFKPSAQSALSFDLGLEGYAGVREGYSGGLRVKLEF